MRSIKAHYARLLTDEEAALIRAVYQRIGREARHALGRHTPAKGDPPS